MKKLLLATLLLLGLVTTASAQLPKVMLKSIDGKSVSTDTLSNNGKPFIIDFFATWCKPCNRELTAISEVYDEWQEETGVKVIAVSIDQAQNSNKVKPLVDNHGWQYEVLLDPNSDFQRAAYRPSLTLSFATATARSCLSTTDIPRVLRKSSLRKYASL